MIAATYSPEIFNVANLAEARAVILTQEDERSTDQRWETETPYLLDLIAGLDLKPDMTVLDYGCGIGRLAKGMIARFGCRVVGVDISQNMRTLASNYVSSDRFMACHPLMLDALGIKADAAIAVWVLQHCFKPQDDIARIKSALVPSGRLLVVNNTLRAIPVTEPSWIDDGLSIPGLVGSQLAYVDGGPLDEDAVGGAIHRHAYWASYCDR